jgi:hypothetical protein
MDINAIYGISKGYAAVKPVSLISDVKPPKAR